MREKKRPLTNFHICDWPGWLIMITICWLGIGTWIVWEILFDVLSDGDGKRIRSLTFFLVAWFGAPFALWRAIIADRQGKAAYSQAQTASRQADRALDRDYVDLFTKAVEQLGALREKDGNSEPNLEVRLGAIHALGRIIRDSEKDRDAALLSLCAYVRHHAPAKEAYRTGILACDPTADLDTEIDKLPVPQTDVAAALKVIGRSRDLTNVSLDLSETNLQRANLIDLDLRGVNFLNTIIDGASFCNSNLNSTVLRNAKGYRVDFSDTKLIGSNISHSVLSYSKFEKSELQETSAHKTDFRFCNFSNTHILDSDFSGANLTNANFSNLNSCNLFLSGATLVGVNFMNAHLTGAIFHKSIATHSNLLGANVEGADFTEAIFTEAKLHNVDFSTATLEITTLDGAMVTMAKFPPEVEIMVEIEKAFGCQGTEIPLSLVRPSHWSLLKLSEIGEANKAYRAWQQLKT